MDIDVSVISLDRKRDLSELRRLFPESNVSLQQGVDLRKVDVDVLLTSGIIGHVGRKNLKKGRKWHHELNSKGGVGLAQANRLALLKDVSRPLFLLEDDYRIQDSQKMFHEMNLMLSGYVEYDMAVFGAFTIGERGVWEREASLPSGWYILNPDVNFYGLHAVLYSPSAREKIGHLLSSPIDMQIDSLFSSYGQSHPDFRILVQLDNPSVVQKIHVSSIQTDFCISPHKLGESYFKYLKFVLIVSFFILVCAKMKHMV